MNTGTAAINEYAQAVASEQAAWEAVRHRLPGSIDYSQELWQHWRLCVDQADAAASRAKSGIGLPASQPAGPRYTGSRWPAALQLPPVLSRPKP